MRTSLSLVGALVAAAPVWAHHSFSAEFDTNKVVILQGTVTQMEWVNPHAYIHIAGKDAAGKITNWAIEGNTPNSLLRAGLSKTSLLPGTEVAVRGYRAKSGDNVASGSSIIFTHGKDLSLRSEGHSSGQATVL